MTRFLDLRLSATGGDLATSVSINQGTSLADYASLPLSQLLADIQGRHVLIGTHGFNVNREDGIQHLANWESLLQLPQPSVFLGLLWPGDSIWAHGLDYPEEPRIADDAGSLLAPFIDTYFAGAASISFASHSLGARVVLTTISGMSLPVRRVTLMAAAIDDDCLNKEFLAAGANVQQISLLASRKDTVLSRLFPLGNFVAGILTEGHPWWRAALGHTGPAKPRPTNFIAPYELPDLWGFEHSDYLQVSPPPPYAALVPVIFPAPLAPAPGWPPGWKEAFTAAFVSTRFP